MWMGFLLTIVLVFALWTAIREQRRKRQLRELQLRDWRAGERRETGRERC
jgi:preprotein translocase subunit YajC